MQDVAITESEGKSCATNTLAEDQSMHEGFSEVYDWRPSVEKTDVMRTMEAIEGVWIAFLLHDLYGKLDYYRKYPIDHGINVIPFLCAIQYLSIVFFLFIWSYLLSFIAIKYIKHIFNFYLDLNVI